MRKRDIRRLLFLLACAGLAVAAFSYGLYRWGVPWVEDFLPAVDTTTKAVLVLLLMLLMAPFAMFWLIFPVLLFLQLRKLTNVLSELAENAGFVSPDLNELDDELRETEQEQEDQANEPL
jgi:glucan phosphoethanolaminetransferase (alkaline phosphatase superfamily)